MKCIKCLFRSALGSANPRFNLHQFVPSHEFKRKNRKTPYLCGRKEVLAAPITWTHKFVCFATKSSNVVPSGQMKYDLKCTDLGEKKLVFRLDGDFSHMQEKILEAFPLLKKGGGFELMRTNGPYSRQLVAIESKFLMTVARLKNFVDQARVYIRPLQADLIDLDCVESFDDSDQVSLKLLFFDTCHGVFKWGMHEGLCLFRRLRVL